MPEETPFPEPIEIPIEDSIDLHLFAPSEVGIVVEEYLEQAAARGFRQVRIIHGRGIGERRRQVRTLLARNPLVAEFSDAPDMRSGWGATLVRFREPDSKGGRE